MINLDATHRELVRSVLADHLPKGVRVFVYGSRATGKARRWSDLDLLLEASEPLPRDIIIDLREAFDESDLPWPVDITDRATISDDFAKAIAADVVPF